jgi:hypothetical protein
MTRLGEALDRLERAMARLEAVCAEIRGRQAGESGDAERRRATAEIAARVDGAITRIGQVLGGEG